MLGRKISWLLWFLFVGKTFDMGTGMNQSDQFTRKNLDLEGAESTYDYFTKNSFKYSFTPKTNIFSMYKPFTMLNTKILFPPVQNQMSCGDIFNGQCPKNRYRSIDGTCNNLHNPTWGSANTRYGRLLPPIYADGIQEPTKSITGNELPLSRLVSFTLFPSIFIKDNILTLAAMQWGQIITHDMGLIEGTTQSHPHMIQCCTNEGYLLLKEQSDPKCYPIIIPYNDPYIKSNIQCMNFVRSTTDLDSGCNLRNKPAAEQLNSVTHYLDLSILYGSSDQVENNLRTRIAGRLRVDIRHNREWPPAAENKTTVCDIDYQDEVCYAAGDTRINQNTQLTVLHILLLREHNRIAGILARLNPHWSDEMIYQETRRILIAKHQHISYYEWLPWFLGEKQTFEGNILYSTDDYVNDYNPNVDPSVLNEHSNAAFRYFHSLIAGYLKLINERRYSISSPLRLSDYNNKPAIIERDNNMDKLTRGLSCQHALASDQFFDEEITLFLFKQNQQFGIDLRATDIQRNRDHGLASYNDFREYCHLKKAEHWNDFSDYISPENIEKLASIYAHPDDVDLTVGGSLERHVPGTLSGPTFLCILLRQFYRTRVGDRFWYETGDHELAFTREQLNEIRKSSISKLFCNNGDDIKLMQPRGFEIISKSNPLVNCEDIPDMDLSFWKDYAPEIKKNSYQPIFVYHNK